jgi:hypothetical protein
MTPKEKADELVIKMYQPLPASKESVKGKEHLYYNQFSAAKQCALISVDEIINTLNYDIRDLDVRGNILLDLIKFWREVKKEIELL